MAMSTSGRLSKVVPIEPLQSHPVATGQVSLDAIKLIDASRFEQLPTPLPRQQDLMPSFFGLPCASDTLVAVSHGWRNQAHPDPCGYKQTVLSEILRGLQSHLDLSPVGTSASASVYLFFDFMSVPQRPFRPGQAARTTDQVQQFQAALSCMHHMYFVSDHIVHLPWDGRRLPGEGREYTVPVARLEHASFTQAGDRVQVLQPSKDSRIHMFDLVVKVDTQLITSVKQLDEILSHEAATAVKLRRYPFGLANDIDADLRGWVFLERFITMVKCAMLDEHSAQRVVITPSDAIREQILVGASLLRAAAKRGPRALKWELARFNSQLRQKHFSPASLDKTQMQTQTAQDKNSLKDREQVCKIMQEFVDHLATRWEEEAARQRGLSRKLMSIGAATQTFLTEWDCFSAPYAARLEDASERLPCSEVLLLVLPLATPAIVASVPLSAPYPPWWSHLGYWLLTLPACASPAAMAVMLCVVRTSGVRCDWQVYLRLVVGGQLFAPWTSLLIVCFSIALGAFPVPQGPIVCLVVIIPSVLVLAWFLFPRDRRAASDYRRRLGTGMAGFVALVIIVIIPMTLLTTAMGRVGVVWQLLISVGFFIDKLAFELVVTKLSKLVGADSMIVFLFNGLTHYQLSVCLGISRSSSWLVVVEQFALDLAENIYYLWSLERTGASRNEAQQQYIMASLALREMLEVLGVVWFLCAFLMARHVNPELSAQVCPREPGEVQRVERYLCVHLALEGAGSLATWLWLRKKGRNPLRLLHGIVTTEWAAFSVFVAGNFGYYLFQNHSHSGLDPTFTFAWTEGQATWECGITWK